VLEQPRDERARGLGQLQVTARLVVSKDGHTISFDTVVNPGGHIRLST